jgi:hypothetical protein
MLSVVDQKIHSCLWSVRGNFPRFDSSIKTVLGTILVEVLNYLGGKPFDEALSTCKSPTFWERYQLRRICRRLVKGSAIDGVYEPFKFHEALIALGCQISSRDLRSMIQEVVPEQVTLTMQN